jgi:hypothetical protein
MEAAETTTARTDESEHRVKERESPKLLFIRARKPLLPGRVWENSQRACLVRLFIFFCGTF